MSIGFSIKSWDKLAHGDVILAAKEGEEDVIGKVDGAPTAEDVLILERDGMPAVLLKSDGWEIKLRKL